MNDDNTWDPMKGHCCSMVLLLVKHVHWQIERENGLVVSKTCSLREREREREIGYEDWTRSYNGPIGVF